MAGIWCEGCQETTNGEAWEAVSDGKAARRRLEELPLRRATYSYLRNTIAQRQLPERPLTSVTGMSQFRRPELHFFEKKSIEWEYALARKWARAHQQKVLDEDRPTVGEMVLSPKKPTS